MSRKLAGGNRTEDSAWIAGRQFLGYLLDGMISVYLLLIIVVMPFYNREGYAHIGTDKSVFFREISMRGAWLILPVLGVYALLSVAERIRRGGLRAICRGKLSLTDGFALAYGAALILSWLCSDYRDYALWGAEGWYMGFVPQMILLAIYFLVSRFWKPKKWLFLLFLPVSAVVFLLGCLNRFGVDPLGMGTANVGFISTIGNINWYCGYLVSVLFAGVYLLWQEGVGSNGRTVSGQAADRHARSKAILRRVLLIAYVAVGFASLVTQGSRSGLAALAVVLVVMFGLSAGSEQRMRMFWVETLILSLVCLFTACLRVLFPNRLNYTDEIFDVLTYSGFPSIAVGVSLMFLALLMYCHGSCHGRGHDQCNGNGGYPRRFFVWLARVVGCVAVVGVLAMIAMIVLNTVRPGSLGPLSDNAFFTFSPLWGSGRGVTWMAGWQCFVEQSPLHKLFGVGPDCMAAFLYRDGSEELVQAVNARFGGLTLTNAHCEWLTVLVDTGIVGCVSFIGLTVSATVRFLRMGTAGQGNRIVGACGLCVLAYTVNHFFSFQQSMSVATIFVMLGIGEAYARGMRDLPYGQESGKEGLL